MVFTRDLLGWVLDEISFVNLFTDKLQKLFTKKDTSDVWRQLVIWMFTDEDDGVIRFADKDSGASDVVHDILSLFVKNPEKIEEWENVLSKYREVEKTLEKLTINPWTWFTYNFNRSHCVMKLAFCAASSAYLKPLEQEYSKKIMEYKQASQASFDEISLYPDMLDISSKQGMILRNCRYAVHFFEMIEQPGCVIRGRKERVLGQKILELLEQAPEKKESFLD